MGDIETLSLDKDLTKAVVGALKSVYRRPAVTEMLGISPARMVLLETGRGRLSAAQLQKIEATTGSDFELWAMATARRRARTAAHHASLDDFYRNRGLSEITLPTTLWRTGGAVADKKSGRAPISA